MGALDNLSPTPQPTESPFLTIGEAMAKFCSKHATIFLIISILGVIILLSPFCVIAVWCIWHDYGPQPPPIDPHKRVTGTKAAASVRAPLIASKDGEGEAKS